MSPSFFLVVLNRCWKSSAEKTVFDWKPHSAIRRAKLSSPVKQSSNKTSFFHQFHRFATPQLKVYLYILLITYRVEIFLCCIYRGCQKNVPVFKRFFLQPLMPQFRHSEHYYGKRYNPQFTNLLTSHKSRGHHGRLFFICFFCATSACNRVCRNICGD